MFQEYLEAFSLTSQTEALESIVQMTERLNIYLNHYPAQHTNCMTQKSEFVAFVNHPIQLSLDLTVYPTIWAVLLILLETQDASASYVQVMHDYYKECYSTKTRDYMPQLERAAERSKNNMYNNTLDGVSAYLPQNVYELQLQQADQQDINTENCTQIPHNYNADDILTEYPPWSTDTNDIENTSKTNYAESRKDILNAWQKDTPEKTQDNSQILDNVEAYT